MTPSHRITVGKCGEYPAWDRLSPRESVAKSTPTKITLSGIQAGFVEHVAFGRLRVGDGRPQGLGSTPIEVSGTHGVRTLRQHHQLTELLVSEGSTVSSMSRVRAATEVRTPGQRPR